LAASLHWTSRAAFDYHRARKIGFAMRDPVIFIGMHRSGTSMLGRLLEELGMFFGAFKDENNEALFFQDVNEWLLGQCGGRWDNPAPFNKYFWRSEDAVKWTELYIRNLLASPRSIQFLGARFALRGIGGLGVPWGWKDPRNTFTLPLWLRIFPNARVVSIERNGVDVAQSLRAREIQFLKDAPDFYKKNRLAFFIRPRKSGFAHSPRCLVLEDGFSLWEEYTSQAEAVIAQLPAHRVLALRYEDILDNPATWLARSAGFCGLEVSQVQLANAVKNIRADRAKAYESDAELSNFAETRAASLMARGYAPPGASR
jgi:Sulfotransferase family